MKWTNGRSRRVRARAVIGLLAAGVMLGACNGGGSVVGSAGTTAKRRVFLDITSKVLSSGNEQGLLGLAFHPNYAVNGYYYVYYSLDNPRRTRVSRFHVDPQDPDTTQAGSETVLLDITQPVDFSNHKGGRLAFGPSDHYLYVGVGDGGGAGDPSGNGQNRATLLGSILRLDVDAASPYVPADNPFAGNTNGYREEIFAYGLRNPWRFAFDAVTGWLWVGDVGQSALEEIDIVDKGGNYGWNIMEGTSCYNNNPLCGSAQNLVAPIWEYPHGNGNISVTGGYVYRGAKLANLVGAYVYGDYGSGRIWSLRYDGVNPPVNALVIDTNLFISSFGLDEAGELYVCDLDAGNDPTKVYKLVGSNQSGSSSFELADIFSNLTFVRPVDIQNAGDGSNRLFVVEQRGVIDVVSQK